MCDNCRSFDFELQASADDDGFVEGIYARRGSVPDDVELDV